MSDPYAGLVIPGGGEEHAPWFLDFGMGPMGGLAGWLGLSFASSQMNKPQKFMRDMLGRSGMRASSIAAGRHAAQPAGLLLSLSQQGSHWTTAGGPYANILQDIKETVGQKSFGGARRGSKNLNWRLWNRARSQGYSMSARYGRGMATRIGAGALLQGGLGALEVAGGLYFGATLVEGMANAIADWEPAPAKGPSPDFGDEQNFYMPRAATTQRMRALQAIHNSQLGVRAALGGEASQMHG